MKRYVMTRTAVVHLALLAALPSVAAQAQTFAERLNPTGDPIGGFVGYSDVSTGGDHTVAAGATPAELKAVVEGAAAGEVVYVEADVDLLVPASFEPSLPIVVPEGVTLASDRGAVRAGAASSGARIRSEAWAVRRRDGVRAEQALFHLGGPGARLTGLRIVGPATGLETLSGVLVYDRGGYGEVDNCDLSRGGGVVVLTTYLGTRVHHNHIHHNNAPGYGYGVFIGDQDDATRELVGDEVPTVEANLLVDHRHHIDAGGGRWGDKVWRHNVVVEPSPNQALVKHHGGARGHGNNTTVYRNLFWGTVGAGEADVDGEGPVGPRGTMLVKENWTVQPDAEGDGVEGFFPQADDWAGAGYDVRLEGNVYGGTFLDRLPTAALSASAAAVAPGASVTFTASGTDPDGHAVDAYLWTWEDGTQEWTSGPIQTRVFRAEGAQQVSVRARNSYGVVSPEASASVSVASDPAHVGLAAAWEFEDATAEGGAVLDDAHASNDLAVVSEMGTAAGRVGQALRLTTGRSKAQVLNGDAGPLQIGTGDLTLLFWINVGSVPDSGIDQVVQFGGSKKSRPGYEVVLDKNGRLKLYVSDGARRRGTRYTPTLGEWALVEFAVDRAAGSLRTYVDGAHVHTGDGPGGGNVQSGSPFLLGRRSTRAADVLLDQVMVYRRLLTPEERAWHYNDGAGRSYSDMGGVPDGPDGSDTAEVVLEAGWNVVSLGVRPTDPALAAIFADTPEVGLVEDGEGRQFEPGGVDEIGSWDPLQAYAVYASSPVTVEVEGEPIVPEGEAIPLQEGWNLVPYFGSEATPIAEALSSVAGDLVLVKDHTGQVFAPEYGIDDLDDLRPGWGYKVYMGRAATLTYPADAP